MIRILCLNQVLLLRSLVRLLSLIQIIIGIMRKLLVNKKK